MKIHISLDIPVSIQYKLDGKKGWITLDTTSADDISRAYQNFRNWVSARDTSAISEITEVRVVSK